MAAGHAGRTRGVVAARFFDRGDIVRISLNPTAGRAQEGRMRPALVLSPKRFNALGTALVAPITQGGNLARIAGFAVTPMGRGTQTQGVVLVHAVRVLDLEQRGARKVESAPPEIIEEALAKLRAVLD